MNKAIQVTQSSMPNFEEYVEEIKDIWDNHLLTNMGAKHKQLENELKVYLSASNVTLFTNGHLALECVIESFKLTGEVITTPFTFASTTHAIVRSGLKPVFCDINPKDYTLDTEKIEGLITDKTSAIIPVHVYGNICNVKEIDRIAKKHNLKVIYDAAHAFGIRVDGEGVANFGDASIFSFHATKVFNTIEGGAITYKNSDWKKTFDYVKNYGIKDSESIIYSGGNAKMNEFQAAMGICNIRHIDDEIEKRKKLADRYVEMLNDIKGINIFRKPEDVKSNYSYFPIVFDGFKVDRDESFEALRKKNIFPRKYFYPVVNELECYKNRFDANETPIAKRISERVLALPIYADLEVKDVERICGIIRG